jgi:hypothetical protein
MNVLSLRSRILAENVKMLHMNGIVPSKLPNGYVPVDIDVTPFDNSKTRKEGVSRTYNGPMSRKIQIKCNQFSLFM